MHSPRQVEEGLVSSDCLHSPLGNYLRFERWEELGKSTKQSVVVEIKGWSDQIKNAFSSNIHPVGNMNLQNVAIHPIVVEIFYSGPKNKTITHLNTWLSCPGTSLYWCEREARWCSQHRDSPAGPASDSPWRPAMRPWRCSSLWPQGWETGTGWS